MRFSALGYKNCNGQSSEKSEGSSVHLQLNTIFTKVLKVKRDIPAGNSYYEGKDLPLCDV